MATATTHALGDATVQELREGLRGEVITPADAGYDEARMIWNGSFDRRPALIVRCAGVADVIARARVRPFREPRDRGARRRALDPRLLDRRRRHRHRPLRHEGRPRRPGRPPRGRPGRRHVGGLRPRDAGLRPGHHRRPDLHHRHRRLHAGRRHRLADAQARPRRPTTCVRRRRHRRRPARARERRREARALLGPARRRRQLRDRHLVRVRRCTRSARRSWAGRSSTAAPMPARSSSSSASGRRRSPRR